MPNIHDVGSGVRFYNISKGVGDEMPNNQYDVMLVQWMLKRHFQRADKQALLGKLWDIPVINGVCSQELIEVIKIFQWDATLHKPGVRLPLSGRMRPIESCPGLNRSTVVWLNLSMAEKSKHYYENPKMDPFLWSEPKAMVDRDLGGGFQKGSH